MIFFFVFPQKSALFSSLRLRLSFHLVPSLFQSVASFDSFVTRRPPISPFSSSYSLRESQFVFHFSRAFSHLESTFGSAFRLLRPCSLRLIQFTKEEFSREEHSRPKLGVPFVSQLESPLSTSQTLSQPPLLSTTFDIVLI